MVVHAEVDPRQPGPSPRMPPSARPPTSASACARPSNASTSASVMSPSHGRWELKVLSGGSIPSSGRAREQLLGAEVDGAEPIDRDARRTRLAQFPAPPAPAPAARRTAPRPVVAELRRTGGKRGQAVAGDGRANFLQQRRVEREGLGFAHLVGQFAEAPQRQRQAGEGQQAPPAPAQEIHAEARVFADRAGDTAHSAAAGFLLVGFGIDAAQGWRAAIMPSRRLRRRLQVVRDPGPSVDLLGAHEAPRIVQVHAAAQEQLEQFRVDVVVLAHGRHDLQRPDGSCPACTGGRRRSAPRRCRRSPSSARPG